MRPEEFHVLGDAAFMIIDCGVGLVALNLVLAGGTGVIESNFSATGLSIFVVGKFASGRIGR